MTKEISTVILEKSFKYIIIVLIILFLSYILFSPNILSYQLIPCNTHIFGKNFFRLSFPAFNNIFNPSILKTATGYLCCLRCSTFTQKNLFTYLYGKLSYNSFILFLEIDHQNNIKIIYPVHKHLKGSLEDPRMIEYKNNYIVSSSECIDFSHIFPVLLVYDKSFNLIKRVDYCRTDYYGNKVKDIQKNWCPFIHEGQLYLHTDSYPEWKVFKIDLDTGHMEKIIHMDVSCLFILQPNIMLRCSTSWKVYDKNYYICGLHTKTKQFTTIRSILVLIDRKTLSPEYATDILCLEDKTHNRIQYLSGLEVDDFYVVLGYGLNDSEIVLKKIAKHRLKFVDLKNKSKTLK